MAKNNRNYAKAFLAALIATVLTIATASPANAEPIPVLADITPELLVQASAELAASDFDRYETPTKNGKPTTVYVLPDGSEFSLAAPYDSHEVSAQIGVGWDGGQQYISFNATDQAAIQNGGAAAIVAVICLAGPAVCIIASVLGAIAFTYINANGKCPGNDELWMYFSQGLDGSVNVSRIICRPVSYPGGG